MSGEGGPPGGVQRFAVDRMLGRLARWLRILGHDVAYGPHLGGKGLLACARREERIVLTRDTRLRCDPGIRHVFIRSDRFRDQLREVAAAVALDAHAFLGRCLECNRPLEEIPRERARGRVPPFVWDTNERFLRCGRCDRLYWPATHRAHMLRELAALGFQAGGPGPEAP